LIRILLWHQSNLISKALATVLAQEDDLIVVAESGEAHGLVNLTLRVRPQVAVFDHALSDAPPIADVCHELVGALAELRVLVLLDRKACLRVGPDLLKLVPGVGLMDTSSSPAELIRCIRLLTQGQPVLDANLAVAAMRAGQNPLTDREREVLRRTLHGQPIPDIAAELFLSTGTVRNYLARITTKTGARTRIEAIRIAESAGWI
jgi:two-component system response regulator DesR